ncbi:hypothetical protein [Flavobacterium kingsejongi]|uniref:Chromosome partitioning protein ParA n=1 Tax=Flavobacterium kingsejongi TaxID=1678728 RepID=A0A2S1LR27_9FLAO|nr:hypothetical protein [Flavobacterium kingsejongi]AWG26213.1 hypothetical protein FK004_13730 [Flavobacterium kingsejongi]
MENQNYEPQKSNSSLKAIIIVLAILLAGSLAYMYKMSQDIHTVESAFTNEKSSKEEVLKELETLKASYDTAIAEKSVLSDELKIQKEKVEKLIADLKKSNNDVSSLSKYKQEAQRLKVRYDTLVKENDILKKQNATLQTERDSTQTRLEEERRYNDSLVNQNSNLAKTVEKASKLSILNLKTEAYKQRSSGKQVTTERARRADGLKISFTIAENEVAASGDKSYYVQVIDSKNNVLGDKKTNTFGEFSLTYSFTTTVKYQNKTVDVAEDLPGEDFEKGTYFVNIFDKGQLVAKTSFTLK